VEKPGTKNEPAPKKKNTAIVDEEEKAQQQVIKRKQYDEHEISTNRNQNRYPDTQPMFVKPEGPKQGGTVRVDHPRAADGLVRINKDGSYQYKTPIPPKSQSSSFKLGMMTPPQIESGTTGVNFETMYGKDSVFSLNFDYEWQPFRSFGTLGFRFGTGFAMAEGQGFFARDPTMRSEEKYTLFMVPATLFLTYRFEYSRRQWFVPYLTGGGTYYGLMEVRNDGIDPSFAGAPAAGGGGGVLLSISKLDTESAFTLSQEYGIADMWLVVEAIATQGLSDDIDFTNQLISAGIQVDF
jgi:hypothetical protein